MTGAESSTFFLPRLIGLRRSMELVLLNPRLDARAALDLGLITAVYPVDRFGEEVSALARRLADRLDYHLDQELEHFARIADGRDFAEGLAAFVAKRPPDFGRRPTGR